MGIKIKQGGTWVDLHVLSGDAIINDLNLSSNNWTQIDQQAEALGDDSTVKTQITLMGVTDKFHAVAFLDYTGEDVFNKIRCENNAIVIYAKRIPKTPEGQNIDVSGIVICSMNGSCSDDKIYSIGGLTDIQLNNIISQIESKFGVVIGNDNKVDFTRMRNLTQANFKLEKWDYPEEGENGEKPVEVEGETPILTNRVTIEYQLEGKQNSLIDHIYFDEHNFPVCGTSNGTSWKIIWEGFSQDGVTE